jgi:ribosome-interacting GTPase 1
MSAERIQELEAKLAARRNKPGTAENVRDLEQRIARLKAGEAE